MTISVTVHCESTHQYGVCPGRLLTDAVTGMGARSAAARAGWHIAPHGDYCPRHSGGGRNSRAEHPV
ncbi:hypothetical protein OV450_1408 [Actinobacteria bacterium OV450]|nr:hypothetical protein OV450_1408 [Actinobacteria bacterium OV450]